MKRTEERIEVQDRRDFFLEFLNVQLDPAISQLQDVSHVGQGPGDERHGRADFIPHLDGIVRIHGEVDAPLTPCIHGDPAFGLNAG